MVPAAAIHGTDVVVIRSVCGIDAIVKRWVGPGRKIGAIFAWIAGAKCLPPIARGIGFLVAVNGRSDRELVLSAVAEAGHTCVIDRTV